jgi:P27 family predicted phage terminase small subunit
VPPITHHHEKAMKSVPRPPSHLSQSTRNWWRTCVKSYELEDHHLRLLQAAAECWDRLQQARALVARDGLTVTDDRGNVRAHPAIAIERDARVGFARLLRDLDLDVEPPANNRRGPPALLSNRRGGGYAG